VGHWAKVAGRFKALSRPLGLLNMLLCGVARMCAVRNDNGLRILISSHDEKNQQRTMRLIFIDTQPQEKDGQCLVPIMITGSH